MIARLQNRRSWLIGGALGALLIIASAWFLLIGPKLSATSDLHDQTTQTQQQNVVLQAKVSTLKQKSRLLARYTESLKSASAALPPDSGLPAFTRQLSAQAAADSVQLNSITVGGVSAVAAAAGTAPAATTTDTPTDSSTTTTTTSAPPTAAGGLFGIQVTVTSKGSMAHQLAFLTDIRTAGPRRALIMSIQLTPDAATAAANSAITLSTQLTIFSAPQSAAEIADLKKLLSGNIGN